MSMNDINRENLRQRKMTDLDRAKSEFEALEYYLTHNPQGYGEELELAQKRYDELKEYFERNNDLTQ